MKNSVGIAFPISYRCQYRNYKRAELNLFFSTEEVPFEQIDLLEPGSQTEEDKQFYFKRNCYGPHDCLVPVKVKKTEKYEAPWGMHFAPGILDNNPTTSGYFEDVALLPCTNANLPMILEKLAVLDFYFSIQNGNFWLNIKYPSGRKGYAALPAQNYCPECWHGFAHSVVTIKSEKTRPGAQKIVSDIPWGGLLDEMMGIER